VVSDLRTFARQVGPWTTGLTACVWTVLVFVVLRAPLADYGIHVSVAERLIAGDRLYAEVWDNKDPLYFQSLALARLVTPMGGWLLEIGGLVLIGIAAFALATSLGLSRRLSVLTGWVGAPVIVVGVADPTAGVLAGVPLALMSIALLVNGHRVSAGLILAFVPFFKITVFPVALAAFLAIIVLRRERGTWARVAAGFGLGVLAVLALLALRGELGPYLDSLRLNLAYSQEGGQAGGLTGLITHLSPLTSQSVQVTILGILLALTLVRAGAESRGPRQAGDAVSVVWWATVWASAAVVGVLAVTGKWPGHAKILVIPAVLALLVGVAAGPARLRLFGLAPTLAIVVLITLLSGAPSYRHVLSSLEYARANINLQGAISQHSLVIQSTGPASSYARVGQGDDPAHAVGLGQWTLACPRFQQYWWESPSTLQRTLDCLPNARVVLVTPDLYGPVSSPAWDDFQQSVEMILSSGFDCRDADGVRICVKRGSQ